MNAPCARCGHDTTIKARGLCQACYLRLWRAGGTDRTIANQRRTKSKRKQVARYHERTKE